MSAVLRASGGHPYKAGAGVCGVLLDFRRRIWYTGKNYSPAGVAGLIGTKDVM